jgi:hypothetical protein
MGMLRCVIALLCESYVPMYTPIILIWCPAYLSLAKFTYSIDHSSYVVKYGFDQRKPCTLIHPQIDHIPQQDDDVVLLGITTIYNVIVDQLQKPKKIHNHNTNQRLRPKNFVGGRVVLRTQNLNL